MHFHIGDAPAEPLEVDALEHDLDPSYTGVTAKLYTPDGQLAADLGSGAFASDQKARLSWGSAPFAVAGLYELRLRAVGPAGTGKALATQYVVVESSTGDGWHTLDSARGVWSQADGVPDALLYTLLQTARISIDAYAPALAAGATIPENYRTAQIWQARDLNNSNQVSPGGDLFGSGYTSTPYPMSWRVQGLLRPATGVPTFG